MIKAAKTGDDDFVAPQEFGCLFCNRAGAGMLFDTEFDTNVHETCLREMVDAGNEEARIMTYLLKGNINTFTQPFDTPTAKIQALGDALRGKLEGGIDDPKLREILEQSLWLVGYSQQMHSALSYLKENSSRAIDHYSARESGGQTAGSPKIPFSVAQNIDRLARRGLNPPPKVSFVTTTPGAISPPRTLYLESFSAEKD